MYEAYIVNSFLFLYSLPLNLNTFLIFQLAVFLFLKSFGSCVSSSYK